MLFLSCFFLCRRRRPRLTSVGSSAASEVYKGQADGLPGDAAPSRCDQDIVTVLVIADSEVQRPDVLAFGKSTGQITVVRRKGAVGLFNSSVENGLKLIVQWGLLEAGFVLQDKAPFFEHGLRDHREGLVLRKMGGRFEQAGMSCQLPDQCMMSRALRRPLSGQVHAL